MAPVDTDYLLTEWLSDKRGTEIKSEEGDTFSPACRSVELFRDGLGVFHAAAFVGDSCYAIGGGEDFAEAKRWLVYRLGVAPDPSTDPPAPRRTLTGCPEGNPPPPGMKIVFGDGNPVKPC